MFKIVALNAPIQKLHILAALLVAFIMVFAVGTALGFEHIGGYMPCKLCLEERIPYYVGVPIMLITALIAHLNSKAWLVRCLFILMAAIMLYDLGLSIYHAGAEYKFWSGPSDCSAAATVITRDASNLLNNLTTIRPPSCDTAAGYFLGLSFAGWNGVASLFLVLLNLIFAFISCNHIKKNKTK